MAAVLIDRRRARHSYRQVTAFEDDAWIDVDSMFESWLVQVCADGSRVAVVRVQANVIDIDTTSDVRDVHRNCIANNCRLVELLLESQINAYVDHLLSCVCVCVCVCVSESGSQ
jgi:hypothetical protein